MPTAGKPRRTMRLCEELESKQIRQQAQPTCWTSCDVTVSSATICLMKAVYSSRCSLDASSAEGERRFLSWNLAFFDPTSMSKYLPSPIKNNNKVKNGAVGCSAINARVVRSHGSHEIIGRHQVLAVRRLHRRKVSVPGIV